MPRFNKAWIAALALALGGCSDLYTDRRETIVPSAGDASATNRVTQMVDPWPRWSNNNNIAFDGTKMQSAVERYRQGRIIPPVNATTSSVAYQQSQQTSSAAGAPSSGAWAPPPAPSVK
jgi:hypothetical protein